jgi:DNA/RNA-binding domain of Phe-tRNA-synthetase-like protein
MTSIRFAIAPELAARFPEIAAFAFRVTGLKRAVAALDSERLLADALAQVRARGLPLDTITGEEPVKSWRLAYGQSGLTPSKFRSSIEALLRRALKPDGSLATGIHAVDVYNAASLEYLAPIGGFDAAKLPAPEIVLREARAGDPFTPLGGQAKDFPIKDGMVIYGSGAEVLCYGFNCRDSTATALSDETEHGIFCAEAAFAVQQGPARAALEALRGRLAEAGAAVSAIETLGADRPAAALGN